MSTNVYTKLLNDELDNSSHQIVVDAISREPIEGDYLEHAREYDVITVKSYCTQNNSDCEYCSLVNYSRDCCNNPIN